jgi:hypothetical protein
VLEPAEGETRLPSGGVVRWADDHFEVHPERGAAQVNDVEVRGWATLRLGDVLTEAGHTYVVLPGPRALPRTMGRLDHGALVARVQEEVEANQDAFTILVGRSGAFTLDTFETFLSTARITPKDGSRASRRIFARLGVDVAEALVTGVGAAEIEAIRQELSNVAGRLGEAVRWGVSQFPRDGGTAEELWSAAMDRLLGFEPVRVAEMPWIDPSMSRIWGLAERWGRRRAPILLIGEEGVGRETFARGMRASVRPEAPFVVHRGARFDAPRWAEDVARAAGGALHLRRPGILPETELGAFFSATAFQPSTSFKPGERPPIKVDHQILLPSLRDRGSDLLPIAEYVLHAVDERLARRRSSLRPDAREEIQIREFPENVRTLRALVLTAAVAMEGPELRAEHLEVERPSEVRRRRESVRDRLLETERRALQDALRRTGWNVSEAARLIELPRRTLVYRMRRLGVRRPQSKP